MATNPIVDYSLPAWLTSGGLAGVGLFVIYWLVNKHMPSLTAAFKAEMALTRESFREEAGISRAETKGALEKQAAAFSIALKEITADSEKDRVTYETTMEKYRAEGHDRERQLMAKLDERDQRIIDILTKQAHPNPPLIQT